MVSLSVATTGLAGERSVERFGLTTAIPGDVFMVTASRHNSESEFLCDYWSEVHNAFMESGILNDAFDLISHHLVAGADDATLGNRDELNRIIDRAKELVHGVDWKGLSRGEMVFAIRMSGPVAMGSNVNVTIPDYVWVFRGDKETTEKNFNGLRSIAEAVQCEVNKASSKKVLQLVDSPAGAAKRCCLNVQPEDYAKPIMGIGVAMHHDDVIVISIGDAMLDEVLALLDKKSEKRPISDDPRFRAAFDKLPDAENSLFFFDMKQMVAWFDDMMSIVVKSGGNSPFDRIINAQFNEKANELNNAALDAYRRGDMEKALAVIKTAHEVAPTDSLIMYNLACFHALNKNKEEALRWLVKSVDGGFYSPEWIQEDADLATLRDDPRYKSALEKSETMAKTVKTGDVKAEAVHKLVDRLTSIPGIVDHIASVEYTQDHSVYTDVLTVMAAGADKLPFYPVFGERQMTEDFARFLPYETVSYSITSGIDMARLYDYVEETFQAFGEKGRAAWQQWADTQQNFNFDVRRDVLDWLSGEMITAHVQPESGPAGFAWLTKVRNEEVAREKITAALAFCSEKINALAEKNPMLTMFSVRTEPSTHEMLEGFTRLSFAMSPVALTCGVRDGYLMIGTEDAVGICCATAGGKHANIRTNTRMMKETVVPEGPFVSASYSDLSNLGAELGAALGGMTMGIGMATMNIPDPEARQIAGRVVPMIGKLGPVVRKINFFKSSAGCTTREGDTFRTRYVMHFKSPEERVAKAPM